MVLKGNELHIENIVKLGGFFIFNRDFKIHLKGGKEMKRVVSMVLALLLAAMLLASCAGGNGDADEGTAEPGESSVPVGENGEIAVVLRSVQGSFWADAIRGIEQAIVELAELGVLASWNAPTESTNLPQQIAIIEDAITRDVMAIALSLRQWQVSCPDAKRRISPLSLSMWMRSRIGRFAWFHRTTTSWASWPAKLSARPWAAKVFTQF